MKLFLFIYIYILPPTANITFDIFFNLNKALEPGAEEAVNRLIYQHVSLLHPINIHVSSSWLGKALNHCSAIIIYIKTEVEKANTFLAECPGIFIARHPRAATGYIGISRHVCPLFYFSFFFSSNAASRGNKNAVSQTESRATPRPQRSEVSFCRRGVDG